MNQFELLKDIDMSKVKKWSALACYAAKPQQPNCMMSADGETVCLPQNTVVLDGASVILGSYEKQKSCVKPSNS